MNTIKLNKSSFSNLKFALINNVDKLNIYEYKNVSHCEKMIKTVKGIKTLIEELEYYFDKHTFTITKDNHQSYSHYSVNATWFDYIITIKEVK